MYTCPVGTVICPVDMVGKFPGWYINLHILMRTSVRLIRHFQEYYSSLAVWYGHFPGLFEYLPGWSVQLVFKPLSWLPACLTAAVSESEIQKKKRSWEISPYKNIAASIYVLHHILKIFPSWRKWYFTFKLRKGKNGFPLKIWNGAICHANWRRMW